MKFSENCTNILAAFVKFQGMVKNPPKNKTAKIQTKSGSSYSYNYADLADIADVIREPMKECKLAWFQNPVLNENNQIVGIYTILVHESGEIIEFDPVPVKEDDRNQTNTASQKQGSAITYARRYSLSLALGLAADEDDDATPIQETDQPKRQQKQQPKQDKQTPQKPANQKPAQPQQAKQEAPPQPPTEEQMIKLTGLVLDLTGDKPDKKKQLETWLAGKVQGFQGLDADMSYQVVGEVIQWLEGLKAQKKAGAA